MDGGGGGGGGGEVFAAAEGANFLLLGAIPVIPSLGKTLRSIMNNHKP